MCFELSALVVGSVGLRGSYFENEMRDWIERVRTEALDRWMMR